MVHVFQVVDVCGVTQPAVYRQRDMLAVAEKVSGAEQRLEARRWAADGD